MFDGAREALSFVQKRRREDLDSDRLLVLGLVKAIEIIGEAAYQVSESTRAEVQAFPGRISSACATVWFMLTSISTWISSGERCRATCLRWFPPSNPS